jgi:hypothetical protein
MGPTVIVPPQHLMAPSKASEIATGFEKARHRMDAASSPGSPGYTPPETSVTDKYAFAFGKTTPYTSKSKKKEKSTDCT